MSANGPDNVTGLFQSWREGDTGARERLFSHFYPSLVQVAAGMLRNERHVSLSSGDLVHEAVIRLIRLERIAFVNKPHFMALAARMMRRALIDHVRAKRTDKRGHVKVELTTRFAPERRVDLEKLDCALVRLSSIDAEKGEIVEMRYFGGMSIPDVAIVTGLSETTVKRRWSAARIWLMEAMEAG